MSLGRRAILKMLRRVKVCIDFSARVSYQFACCCSTTIRRGMFCLLIAMILDSDEEGVDESGAARRIPPFVQIELATSLPMTIMMPNGGPVRAREASQHV